MTTLVTTAVTALRERLNEAAASQWSDVQLRRWLNEAARDIARRTFHFTDATSIAVTAALATYTVPANVIRINAVYWQRTGDTAKVPLEARQWDVMNNVWGTRQDQTTGNPSWFVTNGYAPSVSLKLYPVPDSAGTLYLRIARMPTDIDIAAGTGNLDMPDAWIEVAYEYAQMMALRKDKDKDWYADAKQSYEEKLQDMINNGDYLNAPDEFVWQGSQDINTWLTGY